MLPEIRQSDYLYPVPKFCLDRSDVKDFSTELLGFHENFADCFQRSESRDNFYRYMAGQFSQLERKSIEPIAFAIEGGKVRAMQRFVSDAPWDDDKIMTNYRSLVVEDFDHQRGVFTGHDQVLTLADDFHAPVTRHVLVIPVLTVIEITWKSG